LSRGQKYSIAFLPGSAKILNVLLYVLCLVRAFVVSRISKCDTTETGATSNEKRVMNVFRYGDYSKDANSKGAKVRVFTVRVLTVALTVRVLTVKMLTVRVLI
jgi:hypothetical protein